MDRDDIKIAVFGLFLTLVIVGIITGAVYGISYVINKEACSNIELQTGYPTVFDWIGGCFVQVNNTWIPLSNWIYIEE